jgi:hypothetical protein
LEAGASHAFGVAFKPTQLKLRALSAVRKDFRVKRLAMVLIDLISPITHG